MNLRQTIDADLYRYTGGIALRDWLHVWRYEPGFKLTMLLRLCGCLHKTTLRGFGLYYVLRFWFNRLSLKLHIGIDPFMPLGDGFCIGHPFMIIINRRCRIGRNCTMAHDVTLGSTSRGDKAGCPTLGDNVFIGPGAKIIGAITIGNNVAIGANAVVTKDVPDNAVVAGVPARVLSMNGSAGYVTNVIEGKTTT